MVFDALEKYKLIFYERIKKKIEKLKAKHHNMGSRIVGSHMMEKSLNYDYNKFSQIFGKNKMKKLRKTNPFSLEILSKEDLELETEGINLRAEYFSMRDEIKKNIKLRYKLFLLKSFKRHLGGCL